MWIFDTHAHYDSEQFDEDRDALLSAMPGLLAVQGGLTGAGMQDWQVACAVNVGATFTGAAESLSLAQRYPGVYAACGVHPDEVGELEEAEKEAGKAAGNPVFERLAQMCLNEQCVAVGDWSGLSLDGSAKGIATEVVHPTAGPFRKAAPARECTQPGRGCGHL